MDPMLAGKRILLVITGGIAAYKSLFLIRRLKEAGAELRCILTPAGAEFVTPLSVQALSGAPVYRDLFSLTDEHEMGHIRLTRETDLVVVAPASADFLAKMALGRSDDLASTVLLANPRPVLVAPAMNHVMWAHPATEAHLATLVTRGVMIAPPGKGEMACGEFGPGRMAEPEEILARITDFFTSDAPLSGRHALVTSGPTHEAIDPVRFIANRSSGKQGHAIAKALARLGARTTLVSGPTSQPDPAGVTVIRAESAEDMLAACLGALPADIAVCAAAVSDWRPSAAAPEKIKKGGNTAPPAIRLAPNPDILCELAHAARRPGLVIGFAAETSRVVENAREKRRRKGCDWIVANDVSHGTGVFGGDSNTVHVITADGVEDWPKLTKDEVAGRLAGRIADHFATSAA